MPSKLPADELNNKFRDFVEACLATVSEQLGGSNVVLYYSSDDKDGGAALCQHDVVRFKDAIDGMNPKKGLAFIIKTDGGDIDAARQIIEAMHDKFKDATITAVIPANACSAGSILALSCHQVILSRQEGILSPTDPQCPYYFPAKEVALGHPRYTPEEIAEEIASIASAIYKDQLDIQKDWFMMPGRAPAHADELLQLFYEDNKKNHGAVIQFNELKTKCPSLKLIPLEDDPILNQAARDSISALDGAKYPGFRIFMPYKP